MATQPTGGRGQPFRQGGPASYAAEPVAPVQSSGSGRSYAPLQAAVGVQGAQAQRAPGGDFESASMESARTVNQLMKLGASILQPHIEREQQTAYFEGMNKVIQGQTLAQIIEERPWYTRIFGDGATVEGARAYSVQQQVMEHSAKLHERMPELRKLHTDEFMAEIMTDATSRFTGDAAADAMLLQSVNQSMPQILQQHTRERVAYVQEQNLTGYQGAAIAALKNDMEARKGSQYWTPEDHDRADAALIQAIVPREGMDPDIFAKQGLPPVIAEAANLGHWTAIEKWKQAGIMDKLPLEVQQALAGPLRQAANRTKVAWENGDGAQPMAQLGAMLRGGAADLTTAGALIDSLNLQFRQSTGLQEDVLDKRATMENAAVTYARQQAQDATDQAKLLAAQQDQEVSLQRFLGGQGRAARLSSGLKDKELDILFMKGLEQTDDMASYIVSNYIGGETNPILKSNLKGAVESVVNGAYSPAFMSQYDAWKIIRDIPEGGRATAEAYYPPEIHRSFEEFDRLFKTMPNNPDIAYHQVFSEQAKTTKRAKAATEDQLGEFEQVVADSMIDSSKFFGWFGGNSLEQVSAVRSLVMPFFEEAQQAYPGMDGEALMKSAINMAQSNGVEVYGGKYAWQRGPKDVPLNRLFASADALAPAIDKAIDETITAAGADIGGGYSVIRLPDRQGQPVLVVHTMSEEGVPALLEITGEQLRKHYDASVMAGHNAAARSELSTKERARTGNYNAPLFGLER